MSAVVAAGDPIRVLIADDEKLVREHLTTTLGRLDGVEVVGTAVDGDDAVRQVDAEAPDVILMDLDMPNVDGVEATRRVVADQPTTRVVALAAGADGDSVVDALRAGARGFLTKDAPAEQIHHAITTVAAGDAQLSPSLLRRLLDALSRGADVGVVSPRAPGPPPDGITAREVDVLVEVAAGLSNGEIAAALLVSEATVKTHLNHLLAKTKCRDRAQLVVYAYRSGIVATPRAPHLAGRANQPVG